MKSRLERRYSDWMDEHPEGTLNDLLNYCRDCEPHEYPLEMAKANDAEDAVEYFTKELRRAAQWANDLEKIIIPELGEDFPVARL